MAQEVFKRYEKKYLLTDHQHVALLEAMKGKIKEDEYGAYTICNVYFDTPTYELIRTSLQKPKYKEKLRLRSYGVPGQDEVVFVELKKKFDGVVYKRRTEMTLAQAEDYLYRGINPNIDCQIMRELKWFTDRYSLVPVVYLAYDRVAYVGVDEEELRVTFDTNIRYRENNLNLGAGSVGKNLIPENMCLMELKVADRIPLWLSHLLSELEIYPISFSKYGTYYQQNMHLLMKGNKKYA